MWIFGYGSLIWKIDFPFKRKLTGHIKGFQRRFWQGSTDHRGVPGKPGRVVTLVPTTEADCVYGVAYEIAEADIDDVKRHLDHREKGGYSKLGVVFHPEDPSVASFPLEIYIATKDNPDFLGPAPMSDMAKDIYSSVGPSGKNIDYLMNLAHALQSLLPGKEDDHVQELARLVQNISCSEEKGIS